MGECYWWGDGVADDQVEALSWYEKAAENGNVNAMCRVAYTHNNTFNCPVEPDEQKVIYWYTKAAELGSKEAKKRLKELKYLIKKK